MITYFLFILIDLSLSDYTDIFWLLIIVDAYLGSSKKLVHISIFTDFGGIIHNSDGAYWYRKKYCDLRKNKALIFIDRLKDSASIK